jgi:hypothetical protein
MSQIPLSNVVDVVEGNDRRFATRARQVLADWSRSSPGCHFNHGNGKKGGHNAHRVVIFTTEHSPATPTTTSSAPVCTRSRESFYGGGFGFFPPGLPIREWEGPQPIQEGVLSERKRGGKGGGEVGVVDVGRGGFGNGGRRGNNTRERKRRQRAKRGFDGEQRDR